MATTTLASMSFRKAFIDFLQGIQMLKNFVKYRSVKQNLFSKLISKDIYCNMVMLFVYTTHRVVKQIWPVVRKYYPILSIVDLLHNYWYLFNLININKCTSYQTTWYPRTLGQHGSQRLQSTHNQLLICKCCLLCPSIV